MHCAYRHLPAPTTPLYRGCVSAAACIAIHRFRGTFCCCCCRVAFACLTATFPTALPCVAILHTPPYCLHCVSAPYLLPACALPTFATARFAPLPTTYRCAAPYRLHCAIAPATLRFYRTHACHYHCLLLLFTFAGLTAALLHRTLPVLLPGFYYVFYHYHAVPAPYTIPPLLFTTLCRNCVRFLPVFFWVWTSYHTVLHTCILTFS